jgi:hypothetical protein
MRCWAQHLRPDSMVWPYHRYRIRPCQARQKYSCTVRSIISLRHYPGIVHPIIWDPSISPHFLSFLSFFLPFLCMQMPSSLSPQCPLLYSVVVFSPFPFLMSIPMDSAHLLFLASSSPSSPPQPTLGGRGGEVRRPRPARTDCCACDRASVLVTSSNPSAHLSSSLM